MIVFNNEKKDNFVQPGKCSKREDFDNSRTYFATIVLMELQSWGRCSDHRDGAPTVMVLWRAVRGVAATVVTVQCFSHEEGALIIVMVLQLWWWYDGPWGVLLRPSWWCSDHEEGAPIAVKVLRYSSSYGERSVVVRERGIDCGERLMKTRFGSRAKRGNLVFLYQYQT